MDKIIPNSGDNDQDGDPLGELELSFISSEWIFSVENTFQT